MLAKLALLFTIVPLVDLYVLITIGTVIGSGPTLALAIITGLVGAYLARREGLRVLREWQQAVVRGEIPREGVTSSLLVLVGGVLLITPGVITDVAGLLLLIPPTRRIIAGWVASYAQKRLEVHTIGSISAPRRGDVIDVDAKD